jgi:hypothetical protein
MLDWARLHTVLDRWWPPWLQVVVTTIQNSRRSRTGVRFFLHGAQPGLSTGKPAGAAGQTWQLGPFAGCLVADTFGERGG